MGETSGEAPRLHLPDVIKSDEDSDISGGAATGVLFGKNLAAARLPSSAVGGRKMSANPIAGPGARLRGLNKMASMIRSVTIPMSRPGTNGGCVKELGAQGRPGHGGGGWGGGGQNWGMIADAPRKS